MKRIEDSARGTVPKAVSFGLGSVANQGTWDGALVNLRIIGGDECESLAANFTKVGEGRSSFVPQLVRCFTTVS